jgi:hypothetical protein
MSNRNDDIKQLFTHLGLNDEDYRELRRQSGGTESERAKPAAAEPEAPTRRAAPDAPPSSTTGPTSRFNAQLQPKVFLPGLTPDLGAPEQPPQPSARPRREVPSMSAVTTPEVMNPSPQSGEAPPARAGRWAMVDVAAKAPAKVAKISPKLAPRVAPSPERRAWSGLGQRPLASDAAAPAPKAVEPALAPPPRTGLGQVIARLSHPEIATDRSGAPQLHYAPRPLAGAQDEDPSTESSELGAVFGRLGRVRQ